MALLGFAGALLHTLNHALFKSLLFLGAGAVLRATGTRVIDQLGGLARELPWTAVAFTVGSMAIVGLPPLNGFVSEWTVFQGLLAAGASSGSLRYAVIGAAGLGLIGALALACFTKVDGTLFLGSLRSATPHPRPFRDPGPTMLWPMLVLAALCVAIGLVPVVVMRPARLIATGLLGGLEGAAIGDATWAVDAGSITLLGAGLLALIAGLVVVRRWLPVRGTMRLAPTWGCASPALTPRMQYTASSYAALLLAAYGPMSGVRDSRTAGTLPLERRRPRPGLGRPAGLAPAGAGEREAESTAGGAPAVVSAVSGLHARGAAVLPHDRGACPVNPGPLLTLFLLLAVAPALPGLATRTRALLTGRRGAPVLQLYRDLARLIRKNVVYSRTTTLVFRIGPIVVLASVVVAATLLPLDGHSALFSFGGDLVAFTGLLGLGRFALVLAGLDTGSSFEGMGASREVTVSAFAEPALLLCLTVLVLATGELSLAGMLGDRWRRSGRARPLRWRSPPPRCSC